MATGPRETARARATTVPRYRKQLFQEAAQALLQGDLDTGRAGMRDYINATVGFERLGAALGKSPQSVMLMFDPAGKPTAEDLFGAIGTLQTETGIHLQVRAVDAL